MNASEPKQLAPQLSSIDAGELGDYQKDARVLEELFPASVLCTISGKNLGDHVRQLGYKLYLDRILKASGSPKDPIEAMMVQQLVWAHHALADLFGKAVAATDSEVAAAFNQASVK